MHQQRNPNIHQQRKRYIGWAQNGCTGPWRNSLSTKHQRILLCPNVSGVTLHRRDNHGTPTGNNATNKA
eukprot:7087069-Pyramimonas_sp.AAC.1